MNFEINKEINIMAMQSMSSCCYLSIWMLVGQVLHLDLTSPAPCSPPCGQGEVQGCSRAG